MIAFLFAAALATPNVECAFNAQTFELAGSPAQQAECLLRKVDPGGGAEPAESLPPTLARLIGQPAKVDLSKLAAELRHERIAVPATTPVSETLDHRRAIYFVIHEAVINAVRHAGASEVLVTAVRDEAGVRLTVDDDGRGVEGRATTSPGLGLTSMRERAALIAATDTEPEARWNHPRWWIERLRQEQPQHWQAILQANNAHAPMALRMALK